MLSIGMLNIKAYLESLMYQGQALGSIGEVSLGVVDPLNRTSSAFPLVTIAVGGGPIESGQFNQLMKWGFSLDLRAYICSETSAEQAELDLLTLMMGSDGSTGLEAAFTGTRSFNSGAAGEMLASTGQVANFNVSLNGGRFQTMEGKINAGFVRGVRYLLMADFAANISGP